MFGHWPFFSARLLKLGTHSETISPIKSSFLSIRQNENLTLWSTLKNNPLRKNVGYILFFMLALKCNPIILRIWYLWLNRLWKKVGNRTVCPFRGHFASRLFLLRFSFFDRKSSARIRMALKSTHSPISVITFIYSI